MTNSGGQTGVARLLLLIGLLLVPDVSMAARPVMHCRIRIILARSGQGGVDNHIKGALRRYLTTSFGARYRSFKLLGDRRVDVGKGNVGQVTLPDGSQLNLEYKGNQGEFIRIAMSLPGVKTTIRIRDGGLFFQAGHRYKDGMMVLAISATTSGRSVETPTVPRPDPRGPARENHRPRTIVH